MKKTGWLNLIISGTLAVVSIYFLIDGNDYTTPMGVILMIMAWDEKIRF